MKNYLDFKLNGSKIFPYFLLLFLVYIGYVVSYISYLSNTMEAVKLGGTPDPSSIFPMLIFLFLFYFVYVLMLFYIGREAINSTSYKGESFKFEGDSKRYLKMSIVGMLLSTVTFGIYGFWFTKKIISFFAENTSYNNKKFRFNGAGVLLAAIVLVPMILIIPTTMITVIFPNSAVLGIVLFLLLLIIAAMTYFIYRWVSDFSHDNKTIRIDDKNYVMGSLLLFKEIVLTIITLGLYAPAMELRISRYFLNRIKIKDQDNNLTEEVHCEVTMGNDFFYVLAQFILILVTLGIYYPWAIANVIARVLNKTYIESVNE